ncbi:Gfo/Idh/MocA family protein [Kitasatospora indigofera]|uniref:Gfo/Idh/MocA family protein n=1 Tax=Kitasatospora indigofera TaxID=67307 RepID=UPI003626B1B4
MGPPQDYRQRLVGDFRLGSTRRAPTSSFANRKESAHETTRCGHRPRPPGARRPLARPARLQQGRARRRLRQQPRHPEAAAGTAPGPRTHPCPGQLLDEVAPDFVVVAVPHHAGREVVQECASRGVHVLKEKPFATSVREARELAQICQDGQVELMVTLQRRFNPIYTSVAGMLDQIGTPFLIDGQYTFHTDDPGAGWRGDIRQAGGGCIIDMGYHLIDLLLWYFGLPNRVIAEFSTTAVPGGGYDAEDTAVIQLGYDDGLYGSVLLSRWVAPKTESLHVVGTRGRYC